MRASWRVAGVALLAIAAGCGGSDSDRRAVVLAASSLRPALEGKGPDPLFSFAASSVIGSQVTSGAAGDVVVLASPKISAALRSKGLIDEAAVIARNRLALVVPPGNPKRLTTLDDLGAPGVRLAFAKPGVPLGDATREALRKIGRSGLQRSVVTFEPDAASVVGRVARGEVDAGIGYASDLVAGRVEGTLLPEAAQVEVTYEAAIVSATKRRSAATMYRDWLRGPDGQKALTSAGFQGP